MKLKSTFSGLFFPVLQLFLILCLYLDKNKRNIENSLKIQFIELLNPLRDKLFLYAFLLTRDKMKAEDLLSDSILNVFENFQNIKNIDLFKSYVFKTIRNNFRKSKRKEKFLGIIDFSKIEENIKYQENIFNNYDLEIFYKLFENLSIEKKEAILLFEVSGFSIEEISKLQGVSISAVKSRLKRGREELKNQILINEKIKV